MKKKLKATILGFGGMGHHHAAQYAAQKDVELVALCDSDIKKMNTNNMAAVNLGNSGKIDTSRMGKYQSYDELIRSVPDLDFIDICLPTDLHCECAVRAMRDGFNVLCEKPMALNPRECDKMIAAHKRTGKLLMVAQCLRFSEEHNIIREAVQGGKYGKLLRLDMRRNCNTPGGWFRDGKRSGGALMDLHLHDLDFILSLCGMPQSLTAYGVPVVSGGIDDVLTHYHYPRGPLVNAESSWVRSGFSASAAAVFERGTLELGPGGATLRQTDKPVVKLKVPGNGNMYFNEIAYFAACVKKGQQPELALPESTRAAVRLIELEKKSIKAGCKTVKV